MHYPGAKRKQGKKARKKVLLTLITELLLKSVRLMLPARVG